MAIQEHLTAAARSDQVVIDQVDECIQLAQQGCPNSLGQLYERCQRYLLLIANNELGEEFRAKLGPSDIVQETLLKRNANLIGLKAAPTRSCELGYERSCSTACATRADASKSAVSAICGENDPCMQCCPRTPTFAN